MCDFVSWVEIKDRVLFLTDDNIKDWERAGDRPACPDKSERVGHGAIRLFFGIDETDGINKECTNFSSPSNFPVPIAKAIKDGKITCNDFFPKGLLSDELYADYTAKRKMLNDDYDAKRNPVYAAHIAKLKPLDDAYYAKRNPLEDAYDAQRNLLDADYDAKRTMVYDAYAAKRTILNDVCWDKFKEIKNRAPAWR